MRVIFPRINSQMQPNERNEIVKIFFLYVIRYANDCRHKRDKPERQRGACVAGWKVAVKRGGEKRVSKVFHATKKTREVREEGRTRAAVYPDVINSIPPLFACARQIYETERLRFNATRK